VATGPAHLFRGNHWLAAFLLLVLTLLAYQQAWSAGFVWDDDAHVTGPDLVSFHGLWRIWFEPGATQQYYPVLHSAFWLEHRWWGDAPAGYHRANVLLHAAAAFLLYRILRRLEVPGALLGATAFALHPVCVESVAWISEQKNTLSAVFGFSAVLVYLRYDRERRPRWYVAAGILFMLALATKSVTATIPAALLVLFWWKRGRLAWTRDVRPLLPWFVLAGAAGAVTVWMERAFIGARGAAFDFSLADRILVAGRALWFYAGKLLLPTDLVFIYPRWHVDRGAVWMYLFPAAAAALVAALFVLRRRTRGPLAAALLFAGTLFPALGFINVYPFVYSFVADHFQYLAAAALVPALAAGLTLAAAHLPAAAATGVRVAAAAIVVILAALTWKQCGRYADAETLWRATLASNPDCGMACNNLGDLLLKRGRPEEAAALFRRALASNPADDFAENNLGFVQLHAGQLDEAAAHFENAVRLNPRNAEAQNNLGLAWLQQGRVEQAVTCFEHAVAAKDLYPAAHCNLGSVLLRTGRIEPAIAHFRRAVEIEPANAVSRNLLAAALVQAGKADEAIAESRRVLEREPRNAQAHVGIAHALMLSGREEPALTEFRTALELDPADPEVNNDYGALLLSRGQAEEAVAAFQRALALRDDFAPAHFNLGNVFFARGELEPAAAHYEKSLQLDAGNARAHNNLGLVLLRTGRVDEAVAHFRKAVEIDPDYAQARRNLEVVTAQRR